MESYAIIAEELRKNFNGFEAVKGVSFKVRYGEVYGFLGPNGAGKTTTLSMLTTMIKPSGGRGIVAGYDVVENPVEVRKRIGVVFQDPTVDRDLTAWQNMMIHASIYGIPRSDAEKRARELLEFVELDKFAHKPLRSYSGGMIRRFEIARALLAEPEIVFMDEPTIGLDPQARAKVWEVIQELRKQGVTVFLTTHYMDEADRLCDRIAIIDHGRIIAEGTPDELKSRVGGDTVYLRAIDADSAKKLLALVGEYGRARLAADNVTVILVASNAPSKIPQIISSAERAGVRIVEVRYNRPSLDDVFLLLTGRRLRDEEGDWRIWGRLVRSRLGR